VSDCQSLLRHSGTGGGVIRRVAPRLLLGRAKHTIEYSAGYIDTGGYDEHYPPRADRMLNQTTIQPT